MSGVGLPVGTLAAARATAGSSFATSAGSRESRTRKTTWNDPSGRSPKCFSSSTRTRSESVPGTVNWLVKIGARCS